MKPKFMTEHPLRKKMTKKDWQRIDRILKDRNNTEDASAEEFDAAVDVFFDANVSEQQTHLGIYVLQ